MLAGGNAAAAGKSVMRVLLRLLTTAEAAGQWRGRGRQRRIVLEGVEEEKQRRESLGEEDEAALWERVEIYGHQRARRLRSGNG